MHKISLTVLLTAVVLLSGCYTKTYVRAMQAQQAQQAQSFQDNTNQAASQANK
jgi:hypothetical protein